MIRCLFFSFSFFLLLLLLIGIGGGCKRNDQPTQEISGFPLQKFSGYKGIWYSNQPSNDEYVYKYSGGLGTYPAKHNPFAIYREEVNKTFFCYGGTNDSSSTLLHMVSLFDHATNTFATPRILLDKGTKDAHDNPVISMDREGYIWIFSTSHGVERPSFIHRSSKPYEIDQFDNIHAVQLMEGKEIPLDNFSYLQVWHDGSQFLAFLTFYRPGSGPYKRQVRTINFMKSIDGIHWSEIQRLSALEEGHYQISNLHAQTLGTAFNYHPANSAEVNGLNQRTNLYYLQSIDGGKSWQSADQQDITLPLQEVQNKTLVKDYESEGLLVYLKDLAFDSDGNPVILHLTSSGYEAGPSNNPRTWRTAYWTAGQWQFSEITTSDNNYDMGSLYLISDSLWQIIAPTESGPQAFNPGGELALWESKNQGKSWTKQMQLTNNSLYNHTYVRRPVNAHPDFWGIWADGHGRQASASRLYISDQQGEVRQLPVVME
ncbi:MAG: BNR-4 repeat-containing protein [Bacteroidota bacterium]